MRPVLMSDVRAAAQALLLVGPQAYDQQAAKIIRKADAADRYTRRVGRVHPKWGNGTLRAAAQSGPLAREPAFDDPAYCEAICAVFASLEQHRKRSLM